MIEDSQPQKPSELAVHKDKLLEDNQEKSTYTSNNQAKKTFVNSQQKDKVFARDLSSHVIKPCSISDVNNGASFLRWLTKYIVSAHSLQEDKKDVEASFKKSSRFFIKLIAIFTSLLVISVILLSIPKLLSANYILAFTGITILSIITVSIALYCYLVTDKNRVTKEDIKLIEQRSAAKELTEFFAKIFNNKTLQLEEDIDHRMIAENIKAVAESIEASKKTAELNEVIKEIITKDTNKLEQDSIDADLQKITELTTKLLTFLFSSMEDKIVDDKSRAFTGKAKESFLSQLSDTDNYTKVYDIFNGILHLDEELVQTNGIEEKDNNIKAKILHAINLGVSKLKE